MVDVQCVATQETKHELANSMFGALLSVVRRYSGDSGVDQVLRRAGELRCEAELQDPNEWSTYLQGLRLFRAAEEVLHDPDVGHKAGVEVFRKYAGTEVLALLRSLGSPAEMIRAYPEISAKQSTVTKSQVVEVGEDHGSISVLTPDFPRDPVFCGYTRGALSQFPVLFGMEPAQVVEEECQARGDPRCLIKVSWDPSSSREASLEREVDLLQDQIGVLTTRFESLESVAKELSSVQGVDAMLETIIRRAGVAVRAPRHLLAVRLPGETRLRVHHVGFTAEEVESVAQRLFTDVDCGDESCLTVDIASSRLHFGRLAALYPKGYRFLSQERSLLMAYAGHAAAALETAAALAESRDRAATLSVLLSLGKALSQDRSLLSVSQRLADAVPEVVGCREAHVLLWDPGDAILTCSASSKASSEAPTALSKALRDPRLVDHMLNLSGPIPVSIISDPILTRVLSLTGLESGALLPITARDQFLGVLVVGMEGDDLHLDDGMRERLIGAVSLGATALDNVLLLEEVRYQALHDPITDLPNARLFEDRVSRALSMARRNGTRLAMLFADLDRFKAVNDSHGHKIGDELLRAVAQRLKSAVREEDTVSRLGGDEFGILLNEVATADDAALVASKIVATLDTPFSIQGLTLSVGISIGVTLFPESLDTYDSVMARADSAMYGAKTAGRGQFHLDGRIAS